LYAAAADRRASHHEGGNAALHVRDPQPPHLTVDDRAPQLGLRLHRGGDHPIFLGTGVARVHVSIEHEAQTTARALQDADGIRPPGFHFTPNWFHPVYGEPFEDEFGERLLLAGG